ncbi:FtsK/SpoIIIE domain-containing protein [Haloechinothrix salitolerans]|uniref:FtsK/SpoIIIE domain-containing protein n=1 Tax=Haloechinothrix salitolerans TaxID=926830 RepID=A0ABW2BZ88_9PSEU
MSTQPEHPEYPVDEREGPASVNTPAEHTPEPDHEPSPAPGRDPERGASGERSPRDGEVSTERRDDGSLYVLRPDSAATPDDIPTMRPNPDTAPDTVPGTEVEPRVFDAEIVDDSTEPDDADDGEGAKSVPVDPPDSAVPAGPSGERHAVVPAWVRSREEIAQRTRWWVANLAHTGAYHAVRTPLYAGKLVAHSPRGTARTVAATYRWVFDTEGKPLRSEAVAARDPQHYLKLVQQRDAHVRKRLTVVMLALLALAGVGVLVWLSGDLLVQLATLAAAVAALGAAGRIPDKPVVGPAVVKQQVTKLTSDAVTAALGSLGLAAINQHLAKGKRIGFAAPITREGPGWRADVDLPLGVHVGDIMDRRKALASGLRRPLGCVWPEGDPSAHEGRLVLWVGDEDLSKAKPKPWPLAKHGSADLFQPVPFGFDQRGRLVTVVLMFANLLIGAMPGAGKTFALRVLVLAAALDASAQLRLYELKGSGDLSPFETIAHHYGSGPDDGTIENCLHSLREVHKDLERRAKTIANLPREVCPENKVTPELAARRSLGLFPLVVAIDECQELFAHPEFGKEAAELCTAIIKRGRALGVILILATQRPDKDSLPTGVSANVGIRFCLRVMGQTENDMVLGTSSYKNGIRATTFTAKDKGIGYLVGASDDPQIARSAYLDNQAAEKIVARAHALRQRAGTLTGHAAGETTEADRRAAVSLIADVAAVLRPGETKVWSETIVDRLAELRPEVYGEWATQDPRGKANQLAAALKPFGVDTMQVHGKLPDGRTANRRGVLADDIRNAAHRTRRTTETGGGEHPA